MNRFLLSIIIGLFAANLLAQTPSQREAVELAATVQASPARITLSWPAFAGATNYTVYRKTKEQQTWGSSVASLGGSTTQYTDNNVATGVYYEYKVVRTGGGTGSGYLATGIDLAPVEDRGVMVLLVASNLANGLVDELQQLAEDLRNDGWGVIRHDVPASTSVPNVRALVQADYNAAPDRVKAVYIVGHVPVPYSGALSPDGHPEHNGAWSCDGYYGDMNGTWTDNSVNAIGAMDARNHNVPGDGKFDQSDFPSSLELQVGRVDFANMPAFPSSEMELVRNYLNKAHAFKRRQFVPQARGLVFDNLQWVANPLAGSAYRNVSTLVGASNVTNCYPYAQSFSTYINGQSYLWTYSSGGGWWDNADNIGSTAGYAAMDFGGVFNMSMGSYFGDWDVTNDFLRAPIAGGDGLTSVWSGMPHWYFQHMGMGDNIGYSAWITMNNQTLYTPQNGGWQGPQYNRVHLALMGDPSLRMFMVAPPSNLQVGNSAGQAAFTWSAAPGAVDGYHVYEVALGTGALVRLTNAPVMQTNFSSPAVPFVAGKRYMVRTVKLQTTNTGRYYDLSLGTQATASSASVIDCNGVPDGPALPGTPCNDNNANTGNDTWNANCQCAGQLIDCAGTPGGSALPGTTCNDGNASTTNDEWNANCQCIGQVIDCQGTPGGTALPGTPCNDNNASTGNDTWNANCQCIGQVIDCQGTPGGTALPGTPCNDNNASTGNDTWNANCQCIGQAIDCQGTPGGTALPGTPCNDNNASTGNDTWNANCQCIGQVIDCQGTPGGSAMPGTPCDDGNANTTNDTWNGNCQCVAAPVELDCNGVPNGPAMPGTPCNDGNVNTGNDTWNANCQCMGQLIDCEGTVGGTALPGIPCDDGNANTGNDTWNNNCQCTGTALTVDCTGIPNGPAMPGTPCNDGNANTGNDTWNANCQCMGLLVDCNGVPGGSAAVDDCGVCAGGNTGIVPNADADGDLVPDCTDNCPGTSDSGQTDFDNDGIGDVCDNCTWMYNPEQADANNDGIGDACQMGLLAGVEEHVPAGQGMALWPNPAMDRVALQCGTGAPAQVRISDLTGRTVAVHSWMPQVDVSRLPAGTYLVTAMDVAGNALASAKLVKL